MGTSHPTIAPYGAFSPPAATSAPGRPERGEWLRFCTTVLRPGSGRRPPGSANERRVAAPRPPGRADSTGPLAAMDRRRSSPASIEPHSPTPSEPDRDAPDHEQLRTGDDGPRPARGPVRSGRCYPPGCPRAGAPLRGRTRLGEPPAGPGLAGLKRRDPCTMIRRSHESELRADLRAAIEPHLRRLPRPVLREPRPRPRLSEKSWRHSPEPGASAPDPRGYGVSVQPVTRRSYLEQINGNGAERRPVHAPALHHGRHPPAWQPAPEGDLSAGHRFGCSAPAGLRHPNRHRHGHSGARYVVTASSVQHSTMLLRGPPVTGAGATSVTKRPSALVR